MRRLGSELERQIGLSLGILTFSGVWGRRVALYG
jgi:hypothetical protein